MGASGSPVSYRRIDDEVSLGPTLEELDAFS